MQIHLHTVDSFRCIIGAEEVGSLCSASVFFVSYFYVPHHLENKNYVIIIIIILHMGEFLEPPQKYAAGVENRVSSLFPLLTILTDILGLYGEI